MINIINYYISFRKKIFYLMLKNDVMVIKYEWDVDCVKDAPVILTLFREYKVLLLWPSASPFITLSTIIIITIKRHL